MRRTRGELLALKPRRFDFERRTLTVAESCQRIDGQDVLTDQKTPKSKRVIAMPRFFVEEMEAFLSTLDLDPDERIFPVTKYFLSHEMARWSKAAGLEPIRIHDLRHSHVSPLINMGFTALAIADRMGHEAARHHLPLPPTCLPQRARPTWPAALDGARNGETRHALAPTPPARGAAPSDSASRPSRRGASTSWRARRA